MDGFPRQGFQFVTGKVFLAKLNVVDSRASGFRDLLQQAVSTLSFVSRELAAIRDVVKEQVARGSWSVIQNRSVSESYVTNYQPSHEPLATSH